MSTNEADTLIPYQHPFPAEARAEIVIESAIPTDERLWVPQAENVWFRPLCLNASQGYWTNLLRVTGVMYYVDPYGNGQGYEDVFTKIDMCKKHFDAVGLGADFVSQFVR